MTNKPAITGLEIVVLCNKNDFYLTKICVASIRHFYPSVPVYIIKDELNGKFSTQEMETHFDVNILDLGYKNYGWCTGKIAVMLAPQLAGRKILLLDSDIVFAGKVLDKILPELDAADFIVSPEFGSETNNDWFRRTYYNMDWAKRRYPQHEYPGYAFNCGQMVVTPGEFRKEELIDYIDMSAFPYWTKLATEQLPCRDQSLLNILFPLKSKRGEIRLKEVEFMVWSELKASIDKFDIVQIINTEGYPFLIHWAGALRVPYLKKMTRNDILFFFQKEYYKKLLAGELRRVINNTYHSTRFKIRKLIKSIIRR